MPRDARTTNASFETAAASSPKKKAAKGTKKGTGFRFRATPVLCDDEAAWFSNSSDQPKDVRVSTYIRERFAGLLTETDIRNLEKNDVMQGLIARHIDTFEEQDAADRRVA